MNTASLREYVHLYAEGCLPDYAESTLFAELSHNDDLRAELTEQIRLLAATRHHAASIHAVPQAKNSLFAELGLILPEQTAPMAATRGFAGIIAAYPRISALSASLVSSLATILVMLLLAKQQFPAPENLTPTATALRLATTPERSANGSSQTTSFNTYFSAKGRTSVRTPAFVSSVPLESSSNLDSDNAVFDNNNSAVRHNMEASIDGVADEYLEVNPSAPFAVQEEIPQKELIQEKIIVRSNTAPLRVIMAIAQTEKLPVRLSLRHALGVGETGIHAGIHYALTKQDAIGFEGGMERAELLTKRTSGDVRSLTPEDGVFSGTAFYRYSFTGLAFPATRQIVPFAQAGLGVIGRCGAVQGMVGVRFDVMPELSFTMAAEAKLPVFYSENYFQSKTALSVGVQYHISGE